MDFDVWFHERDKLLQIILLIIPFIGWIVEVLVRLSAWMKNKQTLSLIAFLIVTFTAWIPFVHWLDALWVALNNKLILED